MENQTGKLEAVRMPHARIKRTMKEDPEVMAVSNSAVHTVSAAVQLFLSHFTEQALLNKTASGRTRLTYQDFASAVASHEELEFLAPIIPRTVPYATAKASREAVDTEERPAIPYARKEEQMEPEEETDQE